MKATFSGNVTNARNYGGEKETTTQLKLVVRKDERLFVPVEARFYMGRSASASTIYCSIWINSGEIHTSGTGKAGGYGYHKESAAFAEAVKNAGVTLWGDPYKLEASEEDTTKQAHIGGCGHGSIEAAMLAIAIEAGVDVSEYIIV